MSQWVLISTVATAIGCGLTGGAFYAFSTFIMKAIGSVAPPVGIAAMQSINIVVINPWFMTVLFGPALLGIGLSAYAIANGSREGTGWLLAGALTYTLGTLGVTIAFNVPRNNVLAAVDPDSASGAAVWALYLRAWTFFNHVRTIAAVVAMALLIVAWGKLKYVTSTV